MGANLPKIETDAENTFLYNFQKNTKMQHTWFGMTRDQNNQFYWFDGSRLTYTNWSPGEPNHWGGREHCAVMSLARNRKWNDVSCIWAGAAPRFICEVRKYRFISCFVIKVSSSRPPSVMADHGIFHLTLKFQTVYSSSAASVVAVETNARVAVTTTLVAYVC